LDEYCVVDEPVEEIGLHDDRWTQFAAGAVAVGPVHQDDVPALQDFSR
jgi:hypothetical protein